MQENTSNKKPFWKNPKIGGAAGAIVLILIVVGGIARTCSRTTSHISGGSNGFQSTPMASKGMTIEELGAMSAKILEKMDADGVNPAKITLMDLALGSLVRGDEVNAIDTIDNDRDLRRYKNLAIEFRDACRESTALRKAIETAQKNRKEELEQQEKEWRDKEAAAEKAAEVQKQKEEKEKEEWAKLSTFEKITHDIPPEVMKKMPPDQKEFITILANAHDAVVEANTMAASKASNAAVEEANKASAEKKKIGQFEHEIFPKLKKLTEKIRTGKYQGWVFKIESISKHGILLHIAGEGIQKDGLLIEAYTGWNSKMPPEVVNLKDGDWVVVSMLPPGAKSPVFLVGAGYKGVGDVYARDDSHDDNSSYREDSWFILRETGSRASKGQLEYVAGRGRDSSSGSAKDLIKKNLDGWRLGTTFGSWSVLNNGGLEAITKISE